MLRCLLQRRRRLWRDRLQGRHTYAGATDCDVHACPAHSHVHTYAGATDSDVHACPTDGHVHTYAGATDCDIHACPTDGHVHTYAGATDRDADVYAGGDCKPYGHSNPVTVP